jgi:ATP-binding cassette subfamily C protein
MDRLEGMAATSLPGGGRAAPLSTTRALLARMHAVSGRGFWRVPALMMLGAAFDGAGLLLLLPILAILVARPGESVLAERLAAMGFANPAQQLAVLLGGFVVAGLIRAQVGHARDVGIAAFQADFGRKERADILARIAHARWADIAALGHARVTNAVITESERAAGAILLLFRILVTGLTLLTLLAVAFYLSAVLTAFAALSLLLGAVFVRRRWRESMRLGSGARGAMQAMHAATAGFMNGLKTAMSENSQGIFLAEANRILKQGRANGFEQQRAQSQSRRLFTSATTLFAAALVGCGVLLAIPVSTLIAAIIIIARMAAPTLQLQQTVQAYLFALPSFASLEALRSEIGMLAPAVPAPAGVASPRGPIVFDRAVYRHGAEGGGVGPVDCVIMPGEIIGIAGPSGAGKTTFLDLLTGLIEPQSGAVTVGGRAVHGPQGDAWRARLAYQGQSTFQVNDTIRANLLLSGAADPSETDLWHALRLAAMDAFVRQLPGGLDAGMGEVGATLSGGERQRIALARGLMRRPDLLILDEALAAIDIPTEQRILADIRAAMPEATIVIVAHRPESLAICDRILTFRDGLVEEGLSSG